MIYLKRLLQMILTVIAAILLATYIISFIWVIIWLFTGISLLDQFHWIPDKITDYIL
jgi:hypothetical protein